VRSLWKSMAVRWLGSGSETLSGGSALDDLLGQAQAPAPAFLVRRSGVSHRAIMAQHSVDCARDGALQEAAPSHHRVG
jgi:hypothetical protein